VTSLTVKVRSAPAGGATSLHRHRRSPAPPPSRRRIALAHHVEALIECGELRDLATPPNASASRPRA
jgi:hypothetical protein